MKGEIVGGLGLLEFQRGPVRLVTAPVGPILAAANEHSAFRPIIETSIAYARKVRASFFQLQVPYSSQVTLPATLDNIDMPEEHGHHRGLPFRTTSAPNQMLWIEYDQGASDDDWREQMLSRFSSNTRRDIRSSERTGLAIIEARTEVELKRAYKVIEMNGREQGYSTRTWSEFGGTLIDQVQRGQAIVLVAHLDGEYLGAHYGVIAGQRYSFIMGGTIRTAKAYNVGRFVQWEAMKRARVMGLMGYDLTSSGSPGVMRFKMGFRPTQIRFDEPHYYVLSKAGYVAFRVIYSVLLRHKGTVGRILSRIAGRQRHD
jgi:hypothetical protein